LSSLENVDERNWTIDEATGEFQWSNRKNYWKLSFKEGVQLSESIFRGNYKEEIPGDPAYIARYDLTFLTPCWHQLRCKVRFQIGHLREDFSYISFLIFNCRISSRFMKSKIPLPVLSLL